MGPRIGVGVGLGLSRRQGGSVESLLSQSYTFSRASARTNPETGAEIASGTPLTRSVSEIVPKALAVVEGTDGYLFLGEHPDGRFIFKKQGGTYASADGMSGFTKISDSVAWRVTPAGTLLTSAGQPAVIKRVPGPDYDTETTVLTLNRGFPASGGVSGVSVAWGASGMNWASNGATLWISEYGGPDVKNTNDPPRTLWRSEDDGETWTEAYNWSALSGTHCHALYYDPPTGNLYASIGDGDTATSGIWKSTDDGDSFTRLSPPSGWTHTQPTCGFRFGDKLIWGTDTTPTGVWVHDPSDDSLERVKFDYQDNGSDPEIGWTGVVYYLAVIGDYIIATAAQGHEQYHSMFASADGVTWYRIGAMDSADLGWSQVVRLSSGGFMAKPSQSYDEDFALISGLENRSRDLIATDLATDTMVPSASPLGDGAVWTETNVGYYSDGPNGMRSARIGSVSVVGAGNRYSVAPGDVVEFETWARNPTDQSGTLILEMFWANSGGSGIDQDQISISNSALGAGWRRFVYRFVAPATAAYVSPAVRSTGFTYNESTAYYEIAGTTIKTVLDTGIESHDRAAESVTFSGRKVGTSWGVYDRVWPRWSSAYMEAARTLLTITDDDTSDVLSVVYTDGVFSFTQTGESAVTGATVRTQGPVRRLLYDSANSYALNNYTADWLSYGIRVSSGTAELVVWDRSSRVVRTYAAPASFAPSTVTITLPASGVEHSPVLASTHLTGGALFNALIRGT